MDREFNAKIIAWDHIELIKFTCVLTMIKINT